MNGTLKFVCLECGAEFEFETADFNGDGYFHPDGEEILWGHLQLSHYEVFEEVRDLETPHMLETCYALSGSMYRVYYNQTEAMTVIAECEDEAVETVKELANAYTGNEFILDEVECIGGDTMKK